MNAEDRRFLRIVRLLDFLFAYGTPVGILVIAGLAVAAVFYKGTP